MPCKAGPDFNSENMTAMISEWQKLLSAEDLQGVWGYAPDGDSNSVGDTGWWEIQWTSEESADQAWEEWLENEDAMAWQEKYESVLSCDGESKMLLTAFSQFHQLPMASYQIQVIFIVKYIFVN